MFFYSSDIIFLLITTAMAARAEGLRFGKKSGEFKIIQVADMHYANGRSTSCLDVFPDQEPTCSDLNTTDFLYRVFHAENPDLVDFTAHSSYTEGRKLCEKGLRERDAPSLAVCAAKSAVSACLLHGCAFRFRLPPPPAACAYQSS